MKLRRILSCLLAGAMVLGLAACGVSGEGEQEGSKTKDWEWRRNLKKYESEHV